LEAASGARGAEALEHGLQGQREQQRPQGVTLLNPGLGGDGALAAEEVARLGVTPCGPGRQTWEVLLTLIQERFAVDSVKSVGEVNFEEHGRGVSGVALAPLTRRLEADFCS